MLKRRGVEAEGSELPMRRRMGAGRRGPAARDAEPMTAGEREAVQAPPRRSVMWRTRDAGAAAVGTAGAGVLALARLVMALATLIALLIALAIVLVDVGANGSNTVVKGIHEGAHFFAGAFTGLIRFGGHPKRAITVDWGIALLAFLIAGAILASLIAGVGRGGVRFERRHRGHHAPAPN
ncbi:MAG TPA: hypothetical protein VGY13_00455 [Solirubrobacteraceae bacterium]|nr:hypothetical protein [Solirubrobacteraceae bacterium]